MVANAAKTIHGLLDCKFERGVSQLGWRKTRVELHEGQLSVFASAGDAKPALLLTLSSCQLHYEGWGRIPPTGPRVAIALKAAYIEQPTSCESPTRQKVGQGAPVLRLRFRTALELRQWLPDIDVTTAQPASMFWRDSAQLISAEEQLAERKATSSPCLVDFEVELKYPEHQAHTLAMSHPVADALASLIMDPAVTFSTWCCVYAPSVHGTSFDAFYRHMEGIECPCVTLIRDTKGYLFGCFTSEAWKRCRGSSFYGTGSSFCFSFGPVGLKEGSSIGTHLPDAACYRWTGRNNLIMYSDVQVLAFGGVEQALTIHSGFTRGSSSRSSCFDNEPLASSLDFTISSIEFWACRENLE